MYKRFKTIIYAILILLGFLLGYTGCGSQIIFDPECGLIRTEIDEIVNKIEKVNIVMDKAVGYAAIRPKQYDNFIDLKNKATKYELIGLTNHPNTTVRCYAFWALTDDHTVDLLSIILNHINDTENVVIQYGCIIMSMKVVDFFIDHAGLSPDQLKKLDNALINTPNDLNAKANAIMRAEAND